MKKQDIKILRQAQDGQKSGKKWAYSGIVKEHFFNPKNFIDEKQEKTLKFNGVGEVGSSVCGDVMRVWIWVDSKTERIKSCKWRTFGCASAIAATSMMSVMITEKGGMKLKDAEKLKPKQITDRLKGLPTIKIHCSVLGDQALRAAIKDYKKRVIK
ncbi:MAG: iron-sulfur cluster assembly scaffold protein [bacterium]